MDNEQEFREFLIEAKRNTYAGGAQAVSPSRPLSRDLPYRKGKYSYLDSYLGDIWFIGEEVVWYEDKILWGMNYYGGVSRLPLPQDFDHCLKGALSRAELDAPYRGPAEFCYGNLRYRCQWVGGLRNFIGEEVILNNGEEIYKLNFHGGNIEYSL